MVFRKAATNSVAWAAMGFAFTGAVHAQVDVPAVSPPVVGTQDVTDPDIGDGAITRNGKLNADAATDRHATPGDATGSAGAKASDRSIDVNAGVQSDGDRLGVDAAASGATQRNDSGVNADANSGNKSQNGTYNSDPLGATFDSNYNDDLVIQNSPPGSVAARIGLQPGDRILGINGQNYNDVNTLNQDLSRWNANTDIPITFERNGRRYTQKFRLSTQDGQHTYNGSSQPGQSTDNRSLDSQSISHSANRPGYDMAGNSSNYSYGGYGCGSTGGVASCGTHSAHGQACCSGSSHVHQVCCKGNGHSGGRRHHRRCCR